MLLFISTFLSSLNPYSPDPKRGVKIYINFSFSNLFVVLIQLRKPLGAAHDFYSLCPGTGESSLSVSACLLQFVCFASL